MAKETKTVSLRLPVEQVEWLATRGDSINQEVVAAIEKLRLAEKYADREIHDAFTAAEWSYLRDALNGTVVAGDYRFSRSSLCASIEDAGRYDRMDEKWDVRPGDLVEKVVKLPSAGIEAVYRSVESYWSTAAS